MVVIIIPYMETHIASRNTHPRRHRLWTPSLSPARILLLQHLASIVHFLEFPSMWNEWNKRYQTVHFSVLMYIASTMYFNSYLTRPPITAKSVISGTKPSLLRSQQCTVLESSSQIEFLISFTIFLYSLFVFGSFSLRCCNL